jgi:2-C-methyl-D-erythritol 2,4-cyclodiphosphate synthase
MSGVDFRIGNGIDFHRFSDDPDRPLILGGVPIPAGPALAGHSDADIILHAVADAILGALGLGDIGEFFPDSDPLLKNMDSRLIIGHSMEAARKRGYRIGNCDVTYIGEIPKITPHKGTIRASLATLMEIAEERVCVKGTTVEKMGAIGRREGAGCIASVLLIG